MKQSMHFPNQLYERVEMTWEELLNKCKGRYQEVLPNESTTHIIVRKKQQKYPHQHFLVFEEENLFVGYDPVTNKLCTAMYLDGRWGYKNKEYNADEHYGR